MASKLARTRTETSKRRSRWTYIIVIGGAGIAMNPAACDSSVTTDTTTTSASATNGTGYSPACNNGHRDGYCNAHGADPETCECLDCSDTAFCKMACKDDGNCDINGGEDCTCVDCFGHKVGDNDCPFSSMDGPGPTTGPSTSSGGMGGAGSTSGNTTASTTAMSSAMSGTGGAGSTSSVAASTNGSSSTM